jgi:hypothetical protein
MLVAALTGTVDCLGSAPDPDTAIGAKTDQGITAMPAALPSRCSRRPHATYTPAFGLAGAFAIAASLLFLGQIGSRGERAFAGVRPVGA